MDTRYNINISDGADHYASIQRQVIASFVTYQEAQRAVDALADRKFPVDRVSIIAEGLRLVERVTGRLSWGNAALNGALGGATTGLFLGFLPGLFFLVAPLHRECHVCLLWPARGGAHWGARRGDQLCAVRGERDFNSVGSLQAERYNVVVEAMVADEATRLLEMTQPPGTPVAVYERK
jgi:hypothetical protein